MASAPAPKALAFIDCGLVDTAAKVTELVDALVGLPTNPPSLYMDIEGVNLCRYGSVSLMQIHFAPTGRTYLLDVYTLQEAAFTIAGSNGQSLKDILESEVIPKVFFDVRNDSDALFAHYRISLAGVQDLQLMEVASRDAGDRFRLSSLAKCIEYDAPISEEEAEESCELKKRGQELFRPPHGTYEVFNRRPLPEVIEAYCRQDVYILPILWRHYNSKLTAIWKEHVLQFSKKRVLESQSPEYEPNGPHKRFAPREWVVHETNWEALAR